MPAAASTIASYSPSSSFRNARVDVAANGHETSPPARAARAARSGGRCSCRSPGRAEHRHQPAAARDRPRMRRRAARGVARILARQRRGDVEPVGQHRRHVLRAVDGEVDGRRQAARPRSPSRTGAWCRSRRAAGPAADRPIVLIVTISTRRPDALRADPRRCAPATARGGCRACPSRSARPCSRAEPSGRAIRVGRRPGLFLRGQAEQPVERVRVGDDGCFVADRLQLLGRRQQQLLDDQPA